MFTVANDSIDKLYPFICQALSGNRIWSFPSVVSPRGKLTNEFSPATIILTDPRKNILESPQRNASYAFMGAELLWILAGRHDVGMLKFYNQNMGYYSDDGKTLAGAYGPKIMFRQFQYILETLQHDHSSRQAVITIWEPVPGPSKDIPCTVMMQFLIRDQKLNLHVYMRSNDAWFGFPYDVHNFTCIQIIMAQLLHVELGQYVHMVGSLHLYSEQFADADKLLFTTNSQLTPVPDVLDLDDFRRMLTRAMLIEMDIRTQPDFHVARERIRHFPCPFFKQKLYWMLQKAERKHELKNS